MDWERLGIFFNAWASALDGKHAVYIEERRGEWFLYFSVARSKGLMLAEKSIQETVTATELCAYPDPREAARTLAAKMAAAFDAPR